MSDYEQYENAFKDYLRAKGYTYLMGMIASDIRCTAIISECPHLKDFSQVKRNVSTFQVELYCSDYTNKEITEGLFQLER